MIKQTYNNGKMIGKSDKAINQIPTDVKRQLSERCKKCSNRPEWSFQRIDDIDGLISKLHMVPQYSSAKITLKTIRLIDISPLRKGVYVPKLLNVLCLDCKLRKNRLTILTPTHIVYENKDILSFPPIVEYHDRKYVLIDGTHRLYFLLRSGVKKVQVFVVENVDTPLPATPLTWNKFKINYQRPYKNRRYANYKKEYWRDLTKVGISHFEP
jgi:hypothetical protein